MKSFTVILLVLSSLCCMQCKRKTDSIIGTWVCTNTTSTMAHSEFITAYKEIYEEDGTYKTEISFQKRETINSSQGKYEVSGDQITYHHSTGDSVWSYKIIGDILQLKPVGKREGWREGEWSYFYRIK